MESILFRIRDAIRARRSCGARGAKLLKDERLSKGFTPKWEAGCKYLELP